MRTIFVRKPFGYEYGEEIVGLFDLEGYEAKEVKPLGIYGYRINTNHLYKLITEKNIYFIEDGKVVKELKKPL